MTSENVFRGSRGGGAGTSQIAGFAIVSAELRGLSGRRRVGGRRRALGRRACGQGGDPQLRRAAHRHAAREPGLRTALRPRVPDYHRHHALGRDGF